MNKENKTGYPHIDKPWMQYYDEHQLINEKVRENINLFDYIEEKNKNNMYDTALTYYKDKVSYNEFFEKGKLSAKALSQIGVKKGDIGACLLPNIPEAYYIWQGFTDLGAIADFIDPRPDSMDLKANALKLFEVLKDEDVNYIVALDKCYASMIKPIEQELKDYGIEKIIIVKASDSMNEESKLDYLRDVAMYCEILKKNYIDVSISDLNKYKVVLEKIKEMKEFEEIFNELVKTSKLEIVNYSDLVKECENNAYEKISDINLPNYIGHTSGTTGKPKPIILTNKNGISELIELEKGKVTYERGEKVIEAMPFFAPFGAYDNGLLNLVSGANSILIPEFYLNEYGYLVRKYIPNTVMGTPSMIDSIPKCFYINVEDLSRLDKFRVRFGGAAMSKDTEETIEKWAKENNINIEIQSGYGLSELTGCVVYARDNYKKYTAMGIPFPGVNIAIVNPDITDKLVPIKFEEGEEFVRGELAVCSPTNTNGVLKDGTIVVKSQSLNGESYLRTGDDVKMDRNGILYHEGRKDRAFMRFDGFKYKPYSVEPEVEKHENVKSAIIVQYFDKDKNGNMPVCHIVTNKKVTSKEEMEKLVNEIVYDYIINNSDMSSRHIPAKFKIREDIPVTKNNKPNYASLKEEDIETAQVTVDVKETNLTVEDIDIHANNNLILELKKDKEV